MTRPNASRPYSRYRAVAGLVVLAIVVSGCGWGWFQNAATRLNNQIEKGEVAEALSQLDNKLADDPHNPAFNLLAIKARLALCLQRECFRENTQPPLLTALPALAAYVTAPVELNKDETPLTLAKVLAHATQAYAGASNQPAAVLALYANTPDAFKLQTAEALFLPALANLRQGQTSAAATTYIALGAQTQTEIPATYTYTANVLAGLLAQHDISANSSLIALRSITTPPLPAAAAGAFPWALMVNRQTEKNTPLDILSTLPEALDRLNLPNLFTPATLHHMARELLTTSTQPKAMAQWQKGSNLSRNHVQLKLQEAALSLDPNQPNLWASYLPTLVSLTLQMSPSATQANASSFTFEAARISSATAPQLVAKILPAARQLVAYPSVATPLLTFAGSLNLTNPQKLEFEKLSQDVILKAAALGDVSSTLMLAQTLPGVAQNNRHSIVPLLVNYIRENLRQNHFDAATNTANLLTQTLQMDVEFAPLILEEFSDDLKRRKVMEQLHAETPDMLLQTPEDAQLDLGPIFTFMQQHFHNQPKVISAQLTTLIAKAEGIYGQPTAMYRIGAYFPEGTLTPEQQDEWLGASLEQSLLLDTKLTATELAATATELASLHPGLNLAPIMEAALKRTTTLEEQRTLWQQATPQVREVLRAIWPEFTQLMRGIDALADKHLNQAALAFSEIQEPQWLAAAQPFLEQFHQRLIHLSGIYIPVSGAASLKTAAILLSPQGLSASGKLNMVSATFISRGGTLAEPEPTAMGSNAMAVHRFSVGLPYNFDTNTLNINADTLAREPRGGMFQATFGALTQLALQTREADTQLLTVTEANGTHTTFLRMVIDTDEPLRPDGSYLIQTKLGQPNAAAGYILPPGSLLSFTSKSGKQPAPTGAETATGLVYMVEGSLRHPAAANDIAFEGYFDPATLLTTFQFKYPLPVSGQPAQAAVRCQTLAGPITCGAHNLNSARQAYGALVTGMQTRESMATNAANRKEENTRSSKRILTDAATPVTVNTTPQTPVSTPENTTSPQPFSAGITVSVTHPLSPSVTEAPVSPPVSETTAPLSSTEPLPGVFINNSFSKDRSPTQVVPQPEVEPGAFIDLTGRSTSTTTSP